MVTTNRKAQHVRCINHSNCFTFTQTLKMLWNISGFHLQPQNNEEKVGKKKNSNIQTFPRLPASTPTGFTIQIQIQPQPVSHIS